MTPVSFNQFLGIVSATETDSVTLTPFSTPTGALDGIANPGGTWPTGDILERTSVSSASAQTVITITPPVGTMAFELYVGTLAPGYMGGVTLVTVSATGCTSPAVTWGGGCALDVTPVSGTSPDFLGVVSDAPITSIIFSADTSNEYVAIGGFELGAPAPTPEATTSMLIGSGLILLSWLHRRWSPRWGKTA